MRQRIRNTAILAVRAAGILPGVAELASNHKAKCPVAAQVKNLRSVEGA